MTSGPTQRQRRALEVLAEEQDELGAGRIWYLAFAETEPYRGRRDAGMTRTLDAMAKLGWVKYRYIMGAEQPTRNWWITKTGREVLAS